MFMRSHARGLSQRARGSFLAAVVGAVPLVFSAHGAEAALSRDEVEEMEALLARLNFDPGPVDGIIDERTRAAITRYQQFAALPEDGEANEALLAELRGVAGAFTDLRAQRANQAGADAGVTGMRAEESPEPDPTPESAPAAGDDLAATGAADPMPDPLPDGMPADGASASVEETPPPSEQASAINPRPAEDPPAEATPVQKDDPEPEPVEDAVAEKPAPEKALEETPTEEKAPVEKAVKIEEKPSGFSIRSVLARLLGSDEESEVEGKAESEAAPAPAEAATPPPAEAPVDPTAEVDAAAEPAPAGEAQTASLARQGYAAFGAAHAAAVEGSLDRAIAAYTVALRSGDLTPVHAALAHYNRADALYRLRRYDEAIADYDAAIEKDPSFADAYYNRGYAHQASGDRRRAIADFREARALGLQRVGNRAPSAPPPAP